MKITERDLKVVRDIALSHALTRDQIIELGYFASVTRANTRLRGLVERGLVKRIDTAFYGQSIYAATRRAGPFVGTRISALIEKRVGSPRFLQHALAVTNVRIALAAKGGSSWRFEQQARATFELGARVLEVRPDGLAVKSDEVLAVEVDLGHVPSAKFKQKLTAYDHFMATGSQAHHWKTQRVAVLVVTTSLTRAANLRRLARDLRIPIVFRTFESLNLPTPESWS